MIDKIKIDHEKFSPTSLHNQFYDDPDTVYFEFRCGEEIKKYKIEDSKEIGIKELGNNNG